MGSTFYFGWEETYMVWLQHLGGSGFIHTLLLYLNNFFSMLGEEVVGIAIMGIIYWGIDKEKGRRMGAVIIATNVCNSMIKNIFCRLRPYLVLDNVDLLRDVDGYSFPSGHSANSAAIYGSTAYEFKNKKWLRYIAIFVPICVAISRNFLGAHWPTDVIVGLLQGFLIFVIVEFLYNKINNTYLIMGIILLISSIGLFYCKTEDYFTTYGMTIGMILGCLFEERFVKFTNTKKISLILLRTVGGIAIFLLSNAAIKACIGHLFQENTPGDNAMRILRYALVVFLLIGVYPFSFRLEKKTQSSAP